MILKKILTAALLYSIALFVFGCASTTRRTSASDSNPQAEALEQARNKNTPDARAYELLDADYRRKNFETALKRATVFVKAHPESPFLDNVYNLKGLAYVGLKQFQFALFQFKKTMEI